MSTRHASKRKTVSWACRHLVLKSVAKVGIDAISWMKLENNFETFLRHKNHFWHRRRWWRRRRRRRWWQSWRRQQQIWRWQRWRQQQWRRLQQRWQWRQRQQPQSRMTIVSARAFLLELKLGLFDSIEFDLAYFCASWAFKGSKISQSSKIKSNITKTNEYYKTQVLTNTIHHSKESNQLTMKQN